MTDCSFLNNPGLPGAFGALMDEYARAAEDFCQVVEDFTSGRYTEARESDDPDTTSPHSICAHVCGATRRYADYIRKARGLDHVEKYEEAPERIQSPPDVRQVLAAGMNYTEDALEGFYDADWDSVRALEFETSWGIRYDPEMILEHAIVHLLRHRRQLERWD